MSGSVRKQGSPPATAPRGAVDVLVFPALAALVAAASRVPILTPDVWWHLATGRFIAAHGIPHTDPFSYTLAGQRWTAHEWLADLGLHGVHANAGLLGVVLARGLLVGAAFAGAYAIARLQAGPMLALGLLVPAAFASQRNWLDRPQLASYLLVTLVLWLLERQRRRPGPSALFLPLLFALWVNLHGGFMLGLGMVLLWAAGATGVWMRTRSAASALAARRFTLLAGACALATRVNPNGLEGALYPLHYVRAGLALTVQEERPGQLDSAYAWVHLGLVLCLWAFLLLRRRSAFAPAVLALVLGWISMPRLGGVALPFAAERHAPLFLLLGTPLLAWQLASLRRVQALEGFCRRRTASRRSRLVVAASAALALAALVPAFPRDGSPEARLLPGRYPVAAAQWLAAQRLPGHLVNPYRWGGYLAFTLYPETQVWIDSRGDLYGAARLQEYDLLHYAPRGSDNAVRALLDRYDANVVIWQLLTLDFGPLQVHPLTEFLLRSGEWRLVFYDGPDPSHPERPSAVSAVFLREHPRNAAVLARHPPLRLPRLPRAPGRSTP